MTIELRPLATLRIIIAGQQRLDDLPVNSRVVGKGLRDGAALVYELYELV